MRHGRVDLPEHIDEPLQSVCKVVFVYFPGERVRECVTGRRRANIVS